MRRLLNSSNPAARGLALAASILVVTTLLVAPVITGAHNHAKGDTDSKCVVCLHKNFSADPHDTTLLPISTMLELGAVVSFVETTSVCDPLGENSVRAPPVV